MRSKVWDVPVRLFHWILAVAVVTAWLSAEQGWMDVHLWAGYTVLGALLFRLAWGFLGSTTARFASLPVSPGRVLGHLRRLPRRDEAAPAGHNPLGSLMVLFMLGYFGLQAGLGLMSTDGILVDGPLLAVVPASWSDRASDLHHDLGEWVPWIVGLHVLAVAFYWTWKRQNLVGAMFTGQRETRAEDAHGLRWASPVTALLLAAASAALVTALVQWGRAQSGA